MVPQHIKEIFFNLLSGDISLDDFEEWLYENEELEQLLTPDDYLDLISINFGKSHAVHDLHRLIEKHIDLGEYKTRQLLVILNNAKQKPLDLPLILMRFYDLYCDGYSFLDRLGLGYGLTVVVPHPAANSWEELEEAEQNALLNSFYPELDTEIDRVISWLTNKSIILLGEKDEIGLWNYLDLRAGTN